MSANHDLPNPTPVELDILRILWERGACTVREVYETLSKEREMGYTSALKMLQIMTEKGLVSREEAGKAHIYRARQSEEKTQRNMVGEFLDRAFGGAAQKLVMQALTARKTSPEELAEIRRLLDQLEETSK